MGRRFISTFISVCMLVILIGFGNTNAKSESTSNSEVVNITAKSAYLIEAETGKVLYEKNAEERLKPASVTKVMTLLLVFEALHKGQFTLDDTVTISAHAASMGGSQCFFEAGEEQLVKDLIKCIEVASGNDAAVAMAEYVSGSEEAFVAAMNEKAKALGMENTNFENACGLDSDNHYTCAKDISIMSRELITKYPEIFEYSNIWMDHIIHKTAKGEKRFDLVNTNKFINLYTGATGLKTGYTQSAKFCMAASAKRNDINLIAVIMGADTKDIRNSEASKLMDYGFSCCQIYKDNMVIEDKIKIPVKKGDKSNVNYKAIDEISFVADKTGIDKITKSVNVYDDIKAPVKIGDVLGTVDYMLDGKTIYKVNIIAAENIKRIKYIDRCILYLKSIFMIN